MMSSNGTQMPIIVSDKQELRRCVMHLWRTYDGLGLNLKSSRKESGLPHVIRDVDIDSPAQYAGVLNNDYIIKVGNRVVENEKFDTVLKLIRDQLKKEKKVDLLLINSSYYGEFKAKNERGDRKIDYNSMPILNQIRYYESPLYNPNTPTNTAIKTNNLSTQSTTRIGNDLPPEPRLCHLLTWSHFDGYGFYVAYNNEGCFVKNVEPNSPAQLGGLRPYDRIIELNGKPVHSKDRDYIMKEINKHKNSQVNGTIKSQSPYSNVGTNRSNKSNNSVLSGSNTNYLNLFVADPNTYKWLIDKKIDVSTKNKNLKIQECFTPAEHTLMHLMNQSNEPQPTTQNQPRPPEPSTTNTSTLRPSPMLLKSCILRRLKGKEDQPLGFEMTKWGSNPHYVSKVEPGSAAALSGLCVDDYLIELNDKNVEKDENSLLREKIFNSLLPENGGEARFTTINKSAYDQCVQNKITPSGFIQNNKSNMQYFEVPLELSSRGQVVNNYIDVDIDKAIENRNSGSNIKNNSTVPSNVIISSAINSDNKLPATNLPRLCVLNKTPDIKELGFSIARIKNLNEHIINDVVPGSLADKSGLKPNDCLLEVNGENVENKSHTETVNKIIDLAKQPYSKINLLVVEKNLSQLPNIPSTGSNNNSPQLNPNQTNFGNKIVSIVKPPPQPQPQPPPQPQPQPQPPPPPPQPPVPSVINVEKPLPQHIDTITSTYQEHTTTNYQRTDYSNVTPSFTNTASQVLSNKDLQTPSINVYPEIKICEFIGYPSGTQLGIVVTSDDYCHDVVKVAQDSPAHKAGLAKGDIIIAVNDINVEGNPSAIELLNEFSEHKPLKVLAASRYAYEWSKLLRIRITEKDWPNLKRFTTKYVPPPVINTVRSNTPISPSTLPITNQSVYSQSNFYESRSTQVINPGSQSNLNYVPVEQNNHQNYYNSYNNNDHLNPNYNKRFLSSASTVRSGNTDQLSYLSTLSRSAVDITADGKVLRMCTLVLDPTSPNPSDAEFGFDLVTKVGNSQRIGDYFIDTVDENSPASISGLKSGDRLVEVDGVDVKYKTFEQVVQLINEAKLRSKLKLLVFPSVIINYGNPNTVRNDYNYETQRVSDNLAYNDSRSLPDLTIQQQYENNNPANYRVQPQDYMNRHHYEFSKNLYKQKKITTTRQPFYNNTNDYDSIYTRRNNTTNLINSPNYPNLSKSSSNLYGTTTSANSSVFVVDNLNYDTNVLRPAPRLCTLYRNDPIYNSSSSSNIGFGVQSKQSNPSIPNYIRVNIVNYKSPAYLSGLEAGDYIVEINGRNSLSMTHDEALHFIKSSYEMNNHVKLLVVSDFCYSWLKEQGLLPTLNSDDRSVFSYSDYLRNNHRYIPRMCRIKLFPFSKSFGFSLETILIKPSNALLSANKAAANHSYAHVVVKVDKESPAYASSLQKGDRIIEIDGINVEAETEPQIIDRIYQAFVNQKQISVFVVDPDTDNFFKSKCIKLHGMLPIVQHITNSTDI